MKTELFQIDAESLPVFSMWQPWASWVILGWKPIETRTHSRFACLAHRKIGIHAALYWDTEGLALAQQFLSKEQMTQTLSWWKDGSISGAILGTVETGEHRRLSAQDAPLALIECETPRFGLLLHDPIRFLMPIPMKGKQGVWRYPLHKKSAAP